MGACASQSAAEPAATKARPAGPASSSSSKHAPSAAAAASVDPPSSSNAAVSNDNGGGGYGNKGVVAKDLPKRRSVLNLLDRSEHNVLVKIEVQTTPLGRSIEDVYDGVHDGPELGSGASGIVRLVTHRETGNRYAVKKLDLGQIQEEKVLALLRDEIAIMCQLDHPNVVRLEEVYESPTAIYLIQELCSGGDLFDRLDAQDDAHYTEAKCARLMKQMIDAVRYIHDKGIIHRDLKLENFIFTSEDADSELRMIDFGLSKHFERGEKYTEVVGSTYTVAPEVLHGEHNEKSDTWSLGVITYLLLSGDTPFGGAGDGTPLAQVKADILRANYEFEPDYIWANVSQLAIDFIKDLLVTDPSRRSSAKELQKSEWLRVWADADRSEEDKVLNPNVMNALVDFKEKSDMTKLLCEVLSFTLMPQQLEELRRQFEIMDPEGRGEISLGALQRALVQNAGAGALGSLTENEVEDIFNAMRVRKTEMRIHWHEFIAAALSQVEIDDRNLDLAFQRLDTESKGYLEIENVIELMGGHVEEERMREMWGDIGQCEGDDCPARITKEDFRLLMKGQTQEGIGDKSSPPLPLDSDVGRAVALPEHTENDEGIEATVTNGDATPLVVNRKLYRAHRQMRLAVLEATRRFEEEEMKRTAKKLEESLDTSAPKGKQSASSLYSAGLVMRHSENEKAPSDSVREMVRQTQRDQQARIDKAMKKSGCVKMHGRKKSFSDIGAMMSTPTPSARRKQSMDENDGKLLERHIEEPPDREH